MRDIALTGVPRGGTTLACKLLGEAVATVALAEPIPVESIPQGPTAAVAAIRAYYTGIRRELPATGRAPSKLVAGASATNFFGVDDSDGLRQSKAHRGEVVLDPPPLPGFTLVIKHNASFTALLPALADVIPTIALIRHPLPVLASWQTVALPVAEGRLPAGERLDPALRARLLQTPEVLVRQLIILNWFFERFAASRAVLAVLKYEDIVSSGGRSLFDAAGVVATTRDLEDHNASPLYRASDPDRLAAALTGFAGLWSRFYSPGEDSLALQRMRDAL